MRNPDSEKAAVAVLIVEDEFLLRMDAASFIEDAGFLVYEAENADEAIRVSNYTRKSGSSLPM